MITRTTITIDDKVKKQAEAYCKENAVRGKLSGFIETLIKQHLELDELNRTLIDADLKEGKGG